MIADVTAAASREDQSSNAAGSLLKRTFYKLNSFLLVGFSLYSSIINARLLLLVNRGNHTRAHTQLTLSFVDHYSAHARGHILQEQCGQHIYRKWNDCLEISLNSMNEQVFCCIYCYIIFCLFPSIVISFLFCILLIFLYFKCPSRHGHCQFPLAIKAELLSLFPCAACLNILLHTCTALCLCICHWVIEFFCLILHLFT